MFNLKLKDIADMNATSIGSNYSLAFIMTNVLVALLCGIIIYAIYKRTYSGALFSKNLGIAMVIVSVITSLIVMAISGNLALSLGMIGALSIIRFRTPVKDPKDLAFLFWSVTEGIICGVAAYQLALVSVLFIGLCIWVLSKKIVLKTPYLLVVHATKDQAPELDKILGRHCSKFNQRSSSVSHKQFEFVYEVSLKGISQELLREIHDLSGVEKSVMVSYEGDLDEPR